MSKKLDLKPMGAVGAHRQEAVLVLITLIWGGTFLAVQTTLGFAGPYTVVGLRFGLAALLLAAVLRGRLLGLTRMELNAGLLIGVALFFGYTLQTLALDHIPSSKSAFLTALYVPLVPLLQWGWLRQRPNGAAWAGIALAFVGTLALSGTAALSLSFGIGETLTIAGAFAIAMEILLLSRHANGCDAGRLAFVQLVVVALLCLPAALASAEAMPVVTRESMALIVGLATATAFIQFAMNWAQKAVSATRATLIYAGEPVWAGLVGWLAGEVLGVSGWAGAGLIVAGMVVSKMTARRGWHKPKRQKRLELYGKLP